MKKSFFLLAVLLISVNLAFASAPIEGTTMSELQSSEKAATPAARKILTAGRQMVEAEEIVRGSCWDYVCAVYRLAGYPGSKNRHEIFLQHGNADYAPPELIYPGDIVEFINHDYNEVAHDGIFLKWIDETAREALVLSYQGNQRPLPGRYKEYKIDQVLKIFRPKDVRQ